GGELITVGVETPGRLLDLCTDLKAQVGNLEGFALAAIDTALPRRSVTLMELSLRVAERVADLARQWDAAVNASTPLEVREGIRNHVASGLDSLGIRLSDLGRHEEALAAAQEAVDIYRRLAEARPDAFLPYLAASLSNFGFRLYELRQRAAALAAAQESVDIYRPLVETRPDEFLPYLAQ